MFNLCLPEMKKVLEKISPEYEHSGRGRFCHHRKGERRR